MPCGSRRPRRTYCVHERQARAAPETRDGSQRSRARSYSNSAASGAPPRRVVIEHLDDAAQIGALQPEDRQRLAEHHPVHGKSSMGPSVPARSSPAAKAATPEPAERGRGATEKVGPVQKHGLQIDPSGAPRLAPAVAFEVARAARRLAAGTAPELRLCPSSRQTDFSTISDAYSQDCDSSSMRFNASLVMPRMPQWISEKCVP